MEDFSKDPRGQDLSKMKSEYAMFVDGLGSKQVFQYVYHMRLRITVSIENTLLGGTRAGVSCSPVSRVHI
jgi:hypothetical protein